MAKKLLFAFLLILALVCVFASCEHKHKWGEWKDVQAVTCTQSGTEERVCNDCGERETHTYGVEAGHDFGEWIIAKATCTQDGYKERECTICGDKETETIKARGYHDFEWVTTEATCTANGAMTGTCECGEKKIEVILARHDWKDATCTKPKTCTKCQETIGSANGHSWGNYGNCNYCDESRSVKLTVQKSATVSRYSGKNISITFNITNVSYSIDWDKDSYDIVISVTGKKTYDRNGITSTDSPYIGYEILDENGNVVKRSEFGITHLKVGESTTYQRTLFVELDPDINYTLNFIDVQ